MTTNIKTPDVYKLALLHTYKEDPRLGSQTALTVGMTIARMAKPDGTVGPTTTAEIRSKVQRPIKRSTIYHSIRRLKKDGYLIEEPRQEGEARRFRLAIPTNHALLTAA